MTARPASPPDRGSMAIETAIVLPLLLTILVLVMVAGRTANAVSAVEMAAFDGARTASLARDQGTAQERATASVRESLRHQGYSCADPPQVAISGMPEDPWTVPVGTPASVVVRVTCRVSYLDIALPGMPTDRAISRHFVSPLDQYRARP